MNRIPMLITCQTPMDFGKDHQAAMDSRLNKYIFKTLPSVNPAAIGWLEKHPMDCIHWATIQMASQPNSTGGETSMTLAGELNDDKIKELFQFNLNEELVDELLLVHCDRHRSMFHVTWNRWSNTLSTLEKAA